MPPDCGGEFLVETAYRVSPLRSSDPTSLGDYLLVGRLGAGGMGVVYLGKDTHGEYVAVKVVHTTLATDPEYAARFRGEVRRAEQVPPYCTARFLHADLDHDPPYLVVEYIDGPSLIEVIADHGPLEPGALHSLAVGIATALAGIHGAGVIHRDLKPGNVLLPAGSTKVIDFGLARPIEVTSQLTAPHAMVGTVSYMAPERLEGDGRAVTAAADIFAWGCVVTYAGTGHKPFEGDSPSVVASRILVGEPDLTGLPRQLAQVVSRALAKDPADRPTAQQLLGMLVGGADPARPGAPDPGDEPTSVRLAAGTKPPATRGRRRSRVLVATIATAVAVVLVGAGVGVTSLLLDHKLHSRAPHRAAATLPPSAAVSPTPSPSVSRSAPAHPSATAAGAAPGHPTARPPASKSPAPAAKKTSGPTVITSNVGRAVTIGGPGGLCMDVAGNNDTSGNAVQLYDCNGVAGQSWTFGSDSKLRSLGKCLDIPSEVTTAGTKLQLWDCYNSGAQAWQQRSDGSIFNPNSGLCLDDTDGNATDRVQLQIWYCNGTAAQDWTVG